IIGQNVFYKVKGKYQEYPYKISSIQKVEHIIKTLLLHHERGEITEKNPKLEFDVPDPLYSNKFLRVTVWYKGRVWKNFHTITIRRNISNLMFLEEQASTKSMPYEVIPLVKSIMNMDLHMVVA